METEESELSKCLKTIAQETGRVSELYEAEASGELSYPSSPMKPLLTRDIGLRAIVR